MKVTISPSDMTVALPHWFSWGDDSAPAEVVAASRRWLDDERNWRRVADETLTRTEGSTQNKTSENLPYQTPHQGWANVTMEIQ